MLDAIHLPWPTRWEEIYNRSADLLMEIGFGGGHYLVDLAVKRPDANVLGVEISAPSLRRGKRKIEQTGVTNVRLVQGSADLVLQANCAPASVGGIHINFPDPWPKPSHQRRRLINDDFLLLLASRLRSGGELDIATDDEDYGSNIAQNLERSRYLEKRQGTSYVTQDGQRLRTKYERTAISEGRTCYYFKWRRNNVPITSNPCPVPEELPMPHVVLHSPLSLAEIGSEFKPMGFTEGDAHISLVDSLLSLSNERLVIEAFIKEPPVQQRVGLNIRRRKSGELVVNLSEIGFPRSTPGIQLAIRHLSEWLVGLSPDSRWIRSNLKETAGEWQR